MDNIRGDATGPWGLQDLEAVLGASKNQGAIERQEFLGGETAAVQAFGPFAFGCGCRGIKGGIGGDLYLNACSAEHAALTPKWST